MKKQKTVESKEKFKVLRVKTDSTSDTSGADESGDRWSYRGETTYSIKHLAFSIGDDDDSNSGYGWEGIFYQKWGNYAKTIDAFEGTKKMYGAIYPTYDKLFAIDWDGKYETLYFINCVHSEGDSFGHSEGHSSLDAVFDNIEDAKKFIKNVKIQDILKNKYDSYFGKLTSLEIVEMTAKAAGDGLRVNFN